MVNKMNIIIAKAQADDKFKEKLLANPVEALKAEGVELSPEAEKKVVENIEGLFDRIKFTGQKILVDEELDQVTAGVGSDPHNPCKYSTCPHVYDSAECWSRWILSFFSCKNINYARKGVVNRPI